MDLFLKHLQGLLSGEVHDDAGTRAIYATDASNHRIVPQAVAYPRDAADVAALMRSCAEAGVSVTTRGAGTNCAGNAIGSGIVMDLSRHLAGTPAIDPEQRTATVQPGLVLDRLQESAAPHGLLFGADPSTHSRCTLGGMIGTNACGSHSLAWGTTAANVLSLDVVLADGSCTSLGPDVGHGSHDLAPALVRLRDAHLAAIRTELGRFERQISGYALQHLLPERGTDLAKAFVGSEGTCGVVTRATMRLHARPRVRALVVFGFGDEVQAARVAPVLAECGVLTVEGIDEDVVRAAALRGDPSLTPELPHGKAWLLVEVGGADLHDARRQTCDLVGSLDSLGAVAARVIESSSEQRAVWAVRERGAGLASRSADGREYWPGWEDAAVPPNRLADYLSDFRTLMAEHGRTGMVYGHFGEGCVHVRIDHDLFTRQGRAAYRRFQEEAADLVIAHHGSLSGEHGDGRARSELLERMYGANILAAFRGFKHVFDPERLLNPGVLVDPDPLDDNMRGSRITSYRKDLGFLYPEDDGDLGKALRRCTGVGACRKSSGGGMCPSFRATSEEKHSTRGRARMLAEMLDGEVVPGEWASDAAHEALDMCLSCKACSTECPVGVDMATYKAEFLHQRYRGRVRPRAHYSMGWLPVLLTIARLAPRTGNRLLGRPLVQRLVRLLGGVDPRRELPRVAEESFRRWFRRHQGPTQGPRVLLWVDTFTRSFDPQVARAAVLVLERAGYRVELAPRQVCCGLTWISTGQLGVAKRVIARSLRLLAETSDEMSIVALEPSCATAMRHDAAQLVGKEQAGPVAARIRSLSEMLVDRSLPAPAGSIEAVAQFHCHQRATSGTASDRGVLAATGITVHSVDEGCCGLAGNWGFEDGHFDVSVACAEQALLPALRTHPDHAVLADGFSCRLQIEQLGARKPMHLAELLLHQTAGPADSERSKADSGPNPS